MCSISHILTSLNKLKPGVYYTIAKIEIALKVTDHEWFIETLKDLMDAGELYEFDNDTSKIRRAIWQNEFQGISFSDLKTMPEGLTIEEHDGKQYEDFYVKGKKLRDRMPKCIFIMSGIKLIGIESIKKNLK